MEHSQRQGRITLSRAIYTQGSLDETYARVPEQKLPLTQRIKAQCACSKRRCWKVLTSYIPIIKFIRNYKLKQYVIGDLLSGLTVSFMHLPQGLGFGVLASLSAVHGLYTTFFPVMFYLIFGTSPHISFGTNAVMALLTQTVVLREEALFVSSFNVSSTDMVFGTDIPSAEQRLAVKVGAAMTASMMVGFILAGMGILKLGFLTMYMSVSFISGFTTGAAVHIASSQVPKMFGIATKPQSGAGKLIRMYIDLFSHITDTVPAEIIISIICIIVLLFVKICINERFKTKIKIPIPIDLLVCVVGTIVSHFAYFNKNFGVSIVGDIPSGIPAPVVPSFSSIPRMATDCFVMAILSFTMSISMAKLTARMHSVVIDDNQELVAYGLSNIGGGFFSCFPQATAPPRTMILSSMGAKTTLNAVSTAIFMLLILQVIGQLFVSLPISVLAAMIIVAMKDLLLQVRNIPQYWRVSKNDCVIYVATLLVSVLANLDYGLMTGIGLSILLVIVQNQLASGYLLGVSRSEDLVVDHLDRTNIHPVSGVKIFHFESSLYFANAERFKNQLYAKVLNPVKYKKQMSKLKKSLQNYEKQISKGNDNNAFVLENGNSSKIEAGVEFKTALELVDMNGGIGENTDKQTSSEKSTTETLPAPPHHVIIDCLTICYIDLGGIAALQQVVKEYNSIDVKIFLARCPPIMMRTLTAAGMFDKFPRENVFFDLHDAIAVAESDSSESHYTHL